MITYLSLELFNAFILNLISRMMLSLMMFGINSTSMNIVFELKITVKQRERFFFVVAL